MRDEERFIEEVRRLAPEIAQPGRLWHGLQSAGEDEAAGDDARHRQVLRALLEEPPAPAPVAGAILGELTLLPLPSLVLAAGLSLAILLLELLTPPPVVRGQALAWMGLAAPWLGMLWGLIVLPTRRGAWDDWQVIAPLSFELRMAVRLGIVALVSLLVASALALAGPAAGGSLALVLSWAGPFALGAVLMVALAWRLGAALAVSLSALAWGVPVGIGILAPDGLLRAGSALVGYVLAAPEAQLPAALMLALSALIAIWLVRRGASWTLS